MAIALSALVAGATAARADAGADCRPIIVMEAGIETVTYADIDTVIRGCTELLKLEPKNAAAYHNRGIAQAKRAAPIWPDKQSADYCARAFANFGMAIALDPSFATYMARGRLYWQLGDFDRAIDDFTRAIQLDPKSPAAYGWRASAYGQRSGDMRDVRHFASGTYITETEREVGHAERKELEAAIADYTKALEIEPNDIETFWVRGAVSLGVGVDQAIADLTRVLEIDPQHRTVQTHNLLGFAYFRKGDFDKAVVHYTKALDFNPMFPTFLASRAEAHLKSGRPAQGLLDIERSFALDPKDTYTIIVRGEILEALGRMEEAIADYRKVASKYPDSRAGRALKRLGVAP